MRTWGGMNPISSTPHKGRLIAWLAAGIALILLVGVGVYGLLTGPRPDTADPQAPADPVPTITTPPRVPEIPRAPAVPDSDDPEEFARGAAETLFAWDTTSGLMPTDYITALIDVGDPSGYEQAGLTSDLAGYVPSREAWIDLRQYATSQHLVIQDAFVPDAWAEAVEQAQPGQLAPGSTAITIIGTRHRDGIWNGEPVASEHTVAFTIFLTCPENETCHLLRFSALDNPLR